MTDFKRVNKMTLKNQVGETQFLELMFTEEVCRSVVIFVTYHNL